MVNPVLLTCAERIQYDCFIRQQESNKAIKDLARVDCLSRRSPGRQGGAARWHAVSCAMEMATCSAAVRACWSLTLQNSAPSGHPAVTTVPSFGAVQGRTGVDPHGATRAAAQPPPDYGA